MQSATSNVTMEKAQYRRHVHRQIHDAFWRLCEQRISAVDLVETNRAAKVIAEQTGVGHNLGSP
ncbi:hypothetical protein KZZ52_33880 [Dactylosporangium sp. AC04546]|uniref:hypothetical protein n=1 Tax=Dactylosporangium sp. AC04546 TaxID=2862460 RepID=UPI001EE08EB6|nr:hypothetical protein [Dactylosporangium sp. AC04546]WVK78964.1 hypothetical protein KZZ52_33880 [Dactylosporangium sp. AC04546]